MLIFVLFIHLIFLAAFTYRLQKGESTSLKIYFWPALFIKMISGIALGLLYIYYYSLGDTFQYFKDGSLLASFARNNLVSYFSFLWSGNESFDIWQSLGLTVPRALFLVKIVSVICLLTLNDYWLVSLYFSLASFYGAWLLLKQVIALNPTYKHPALAAILFFPSVVFWSSGLMKESLAMACLFFLSALFLKTWRKENPKLMEWVLMCIAVWLLWNLKYYYLAVFLPIVFASFVFKFFIHPFLTTKKIIIRILIWLIVLIIPLAVMSFIRPNFYPDRFLHVIVSNNDVFNQRSDAWDAIHYSNLQPNAFSVFVNSPWALFSGLFRPFLWEVNTVFQFLVAIENTFIFLLTASAIFRGRTALQTPNRLLVFSIITYTSILCVFLALSTPNFGTLVRYKVGFLPFFLLIILIDNPILFRIFSFYEMAMHKIHRIS